MSTDQGGDARQNPRQHHQRPCGSVWRCVCGAPAQGTRRPALLSATRSSNLPSNSPAFSLAVRTPPSPPLPCARPLAAKGSCSRLRARVSCPVGRPGGCSSCGKRARRSRVGGARRAGGCWTASLGSRWRVSMDTARSTNHPSIHSYPPRTRL